MTRSHKHNDIPKNTDEPAPDKAIPKFFGKHGFTDQAPNKVKKNGGGKGNWGHDGGEVEDLEEYISYKPRRRSNSISHAEAMMPTKFDQNDPEPVFEEELETVETNTSTTSTTSASSAKA
ncbi:hypothetical protein BZA05DRAFT_421904 [Tricharina praecox]|uniref:uncharacterized protein n=1 Tax=Tricharina praecox TaxID=43433 RepID=UPI00221F97A1|nr:uncharacterized protein BZA05DRAFT_421904 [Tricharina praecox]KAI5844122.1 hypothetical protein BZA05DRAFT_421904 [Tricharina praecox]